MTIHPLITLLLNPFAGPAGFNLLSAGFYLAIALCVLVALIERSFHNHN